MLSPKTDTHSTLVPTNDWKTLLERWERTRGAHWLRPLRKASYGTLVGMGMPLLLAGAFLPLMPSAPDHTFLLGLKITMAVCGSCLLAVAAVFGRGLTTTQKQILADLGKVEDIRVIGPLLQALDAATTEPARMALMNVLAGLLPRLTETDRSLLTPSQTALLYGAIHSPPQITHPNPAFVAAALDAIGIVGDTNALPVLARIIVKDAPSHGELAARDHARQSLQKLMQSLDFGTVENIPGWVAHLPIYSETSGPSLPSGANWEQSLVAMFALTRLLPQLTPEQTSQLSRPDRSRVVDATATIRHMLSGGGTEGGLDIQSSRLGADFKLAVITALRNVGTGEDAGHIRHWAYAEAPSEADRYARDMARDVLPILEARREKEKVSLTLLRGASAPPTAPDQLLRPALSDSYDTRNARPDELLHPHSEPQTEQRLS